MDRGSVTQNARLASVAPTEKSRLDDIGCTEDKLTNMLFFAVLICSPHQETCLVCHLTA